MKILHNEVHEDGSAWVAAVEFKGVLYRASYVNNRLNVGLGPYKNAPRRPRWYDKAVKDWAEKQVRELPPEWHAKHYKLYAEDEE